MKKNKAMYTLQQDIKIPDIVETKASQTFARIQSGSKRQEMRRSLFMIKRSEGQRKNMRCWQ